MIDFTDLLLKPFFSLDRGIIIMQKHKRAVLDDFTDLTNIFFPS